MPDRPTVLLHSNWGADRYATDEEIAEAARRDRREVFWWRVSLVALMAGVTILAWWMLVTYPIEH